MTKDTEPLIAPNWNRDLHLIIEALQNDNLWLVDMQLKYITVQVDTRSGGAFVLQDRDGNPVSIDRLMGAHHESLDRWGPGRAHVRGRSDAPTDKPALFKKLEK